MKKIVFSAPLIAIAFLVSCGENKTTYNLTTFKDNNGFSTSSNDQRWYEYEDWWNHCSSDDEGERATEEDIGQLVNVPVNGQVHKVRLIGIDQDVDEQGTQLHCTFEFYNLISDEYGNSLTTQYNDVSDVTTAAYDFPNSTLRCALDGKGGAGGRFSWAQKGQTMWSEAYHNKTVLEMLPNVLSNVIKPAKKIVNVRRDDGEWRQEEIVDELFLLSPREMGYIASDTEGEPYGYYKNATKQTRQIRVKKQTNTNVVYTKSSIIPAGSGQAYNVQIFNEAGQNLQAEETEGNYLTEGAEYMLRSPEKADYYVDFWTVSAGGRCDNISYYFVTYPVAPAFCI